MRVSQINYLPLPSASANNWSARHWQITIFCSTSSNNCSLSNRCHLNIINHTTWFLPQTQKLEPPSTEEQTVLKEFYFMVTVKDFIQTHCVTQDLSKTDWIWANLVNCVLRLVDFVFSFVYFQKLFEQVRNHGISIEHWPSWISRELSTASATQVDHDTED